MLLMLSPARSWPKPRTQCPYCAHVSPDESKFCNECGAALNLAPCPHCGAVNDLSLMDVCARCHGDLQADAESASEAAAPAPGEAPADPIPPLPPLPTLVLTAPRPKARPWSLLLGGLVLMAGAATAGYLVYQQRSAPSAQSTAVIDAAVREALDAQPLALSASMPASAAAAPPAALATARPIEVTATAFEPEPAATPAPQRPVKPLPARLPAQAPRSAVEPPPPKIGPCTDAVAALGLCRSGGPDIPTRSP